MTKTLGKIKEMASDIYQKILKKKQPSMTFPLRVLNNVKYDPKKGFFELLGKVKVRTLSVNTVKTFAQTLRMMAISKDLIATDDMATKREVYYVSKNWGDARFMEQPESDLVMDDIEAMFMVNREQLGFSADEHGGDVAGELIVIDKNPDTKKVIKIDCTKFGSGAYSIPTSVEHLEFETKAMFILAIETKGMFERLNRHNYWKKSHCILVSMGGVPSRACRRFIRKLADEKKLSVYVFTDADPYGWSSIYRTLKVGSGNAAHINEFFCVPQARFLGITAQDINDYKLPTHPLKEVDLKKIKDLFKNDPFIQSHKEWAKELKLLEQMGKRAEQQSLAAHGLNFVMEKYLPQKLKHPEKCLP